jgi:hypothetical protein
MAAGVVAVVLAAALVVVVVVSAMLLPLPRGLMQAVVAEVAMLLSLLVQAAAVPVVTQ